MSRSIRNTSWSYACGIIYITPIKLDPIPLTKEKQVLHYFDVTVITYFISSECKGDDITNQPGLAEQNTIDQVA